MDKRSRRRTRDLVTQLASQGLSQNEIGCARISMMARGINAPFKGRIQMRKINPLHRSHLTCNARPVHTPVHTVGSGAWDLGFAPHVRCYPERGHSIAPQYLTRCGHNRTNRTVAGLENCSVQNLTTAVKLTSRCALNPRIDFVA